MKGGDFIKGYINNKKDLGINISDYFSLGNIDKTLKTFEERTQLILCNQEDKEISVLKNVHDIELTTPFQDTYELTFKISYYLKNGYEQILNPILDEIKNGLLVKFNNKYMFIIKEIEDTDEDIYSKKVHCYSREINLSKRNVVNFAGTRQLYRDGSEALVTKIKYSFDNNKYFDYSSSFEMEENKNLFIKIYDANDVEMDNFKWNSKDKLTKLKGIDVTYKIVDSVKFKIKVNIKIVAETGDGILNILENETSWKIGYIDPEIREDRSLGQNHRKYRTFDVTDQNWLSFLREDIAKNFKCIICFDTINKIINFYHINNITEDKGLFISKQNYAKSISKNVNDADVVTRLNIYGKDNVSITDINPTGMPYIENYTYYYNVMPKKLVKSLHKYDLLVKDKTPIFYNLLQERSSLEQTVYKLQNELVDIKIQYEIAQDNVDLGIQYNDKDIGVIKSSSNDGTKDISEELHIDLSDFDSPKDLSNLNKIRDNIKQKLDVKQKEIDGKQKEKEKNQKSINNLKEILKKENNFTIQQLEVLDQFIKIDTWRNENLKDTKDLLAQGKNALDKLSKPRIEINLEVIDFLNLVECQHDWNKLKIGDLIHVYSDKIGENVVRITDIQYEIDNHKISVTISNKEFMDNTANYLADIIKNTNEVANTVNMFKPIWDTSADNQDLISNIMNNALDASQNRILGARNQNIHIDERGINMKDMFSDDEQLRIVNNRLCMTKDGWNSASLAISPNGIVAEQIYGKVVGSNKLIITNKNDKGESSFLVDKNHMKAINMDLSLEGNNSRNRIFLNPLVGIKLQKRKNSGYPWEDVIFLDGNDGSVWAKSFHVLNTHTLLDNKGLTIDNGCIWINNNNEDNVFKVNNEGEVDANGRFRVFRYDNSNDKVWLADLYKDEGNGGKLLINNWEGHINSFLGSAPDENYTGGFLKLYNGDITKERIEIGTLSLNDTGIMKIKNNESKNIVELSGNDDGGIITLNDKLERNKVYLSSQDLTEGSINQGIIKLFGEDNNPKLILKAKSSIDNMSRLVAGDRKTGGYAQFFSYDGTSKYTLTANNENNFGMYDEFGNAYEINHNIDAMIIAHKNKSNLSLQGGGLYLKVTNLNNMRIDYFRSGSIYDKSNALTFYLPIMMKRTSSFTGTDGTVITHNLNCLDYVVSVTPVNNGKPTGAYIGEITVEKESNRVIIYNTGKARRKFDCVILK